MEMTCTRCCHAIRRGAQFCGHCGLEVTYALAPVQAPRSHDIVTPSVPCPPDNPSAVQAQLEVMTRLNPLMNQERMKARVMDIAARGGTGTVGFWSDD